MAKAFNLELAMPEEPTEAQARAATALKDPARAVGLSLTTRGAGELGYRARIKWPLVVALYHRLNGERMTVKFEPGAEGGTRVAISGKVASSNHTLASDPDHWSEALGVAAH
jgi:hypothetical protein